MSDDEIFERVSKQFDVDGEYTPLVKDSDYEVKFTNNKNKGTAIANINTEN